MKIPENQIDLLDAVFNVNPNIVAILSCGSAVEMPWIGKVRGLVHGYLGGQAGARSILRVLSGDVNPSGKLAETFPSNMRTHLLFFISQVKRLLLSIGKVFLLVIVIMILPILMCSFRLDSGSAIQPLNTRIFRLLRRE